MQDLLNQIGLPLIAVLVPIVMIGVKGLLPRLPTASIPLLAGVLGPALDWALAALASVEASDPTVAALVGLAGVGLREVVDQIRKTIKANEGRLSAHPLATAAAIALLGLSAGGCSAMLPQMAPIMGAVDGAVDGAGEKGGIDAESASLQQRVGDRLFGVAESLAVREARLEMACAAYAYLLADRVTRFDPGIAGEASARLDALHAGCFGRDLAAEEFFAETALGEVTIELAAIAVDTGLERARGLAGLFAGGINVTGLLTRGRVVARQAFFVDLLLSDIHAAVALMNRDPARVVPAKASARAMFCASFNRIKAMTGGVPIVCLDPAAPEV